PRGVGFVVWPVAGLLYGLTMSWYLTLMRPRNSVRPDTTGVPFVVDHSLAIRGAGAVTFVAFSASLIVCVAILGGVDVPLLTFTPLQAALMAILAVPTLLVLATAMTRIVVDETGFEIRGLLGARSVPWNAVRRVDSLGDRYRYIPGGN